MRAVLVTVLATLAACGTPASDQALIGTWKRVRDDASLRDQYTFRRDGTFAFDEFKPTEPASEDHLAGTYQASDRTVTADVSDPKDARPVRLTFSYFVNTGSFSPAALRPTGTHEGIVGVWEGIAKIEHLDQPGSVPDGSSLVQAFRADGTFTTTSSAHDGSAPKIAEGTYLETSPGLFSATAVTDTGTSVVTLQMLDGVALVSPDRIWTRE
ncbi:MAG TPA: hypothetical protein VNO55_21730 [Polyangia bacterium]|nr:hypothetical protein [Polyangia bacterium]